MTAATGGGQQPFEVLTVSGLSKAFAETQALDDVDFGLRRSEIHGLIGANGSGKSTLIKILAGVYSADRGTVAAAAGAYEAADMTPTKASSLGLRFVHQGSTAVPDLTVAENLAIGHGFPRGIGGRVRWSELNRRAKKTLERFGIDAGPRQLMRELGPAVQTTVAIARALQDLDEESSGILVLDEPTAALPRAEVRALFEALRRYAQAGQAIVLVTHRVDELLAVCDRVTVLRDGRRVATTPIAELDERKLIELIVGRPLDRLYADSKVETLGDVALEVAGVSGEPLVDVSFEVRGGEVVGIAGLLGSGRTELLQTLFGSRDPGSGAIRIHGREVTFGSPADAMAAGVGYVPEDRSGAAAFSDMSLIENLSIARIGEYRFGLWLDKRRERGDAARAIDRYSVKASSPRALLGTLSGGNQQKVILARWLAREPSVLLLDEPTQGVDIGARSEIYQLIETAAERGCAVLLVSSDFEELVHVSDRVVVLSNGRISASLGAEGLDSHELTELTYSNLEVAQ